jgi:hypothetical protein
MSAFIKDLRYCPPQALTPENLRGLAFDLVPHASAAFWRVAAHIVHQKKGAQMWVSKEVSDDLLASDIDDPDFGDVEWPHAYLEVYFEDASLPAFLLQHGNRDMLRDEFCKLAELPLDMLRIQRTAEEGYQEGDKLVDLLAQTADGAIASVTLSHRDMNSYASGGEVPGFHAGEKQSLNADLDPAEEAELRRLALLAFKLLLFSSSEGFEPRVTDEQPTKKQGGKAGFKDRPKTKRLIVEYLPHHRTAKKKARAEETGKSHEFRGRRGHWRVYRHERYKAMRGVRQFVPPVPGPDGTIPSRRFVVKK